MPRSQDKNKTITSQQALEKARYFCAYQERCHQEVRDKLYALGQHGEKVEHILSTLITDGYLNEERFSKIFAGGKFRIKKWGRIKIVRELKKRKVSEYCINTAMDGIDTADYRNTVLELIEKKNKTIKDKNPYLRKGKIAKYLINKGYEADLVMDLLQE